MEHLCNNLDSADVISEVLSQSKSRTALLHMQNQFASAWDISVYGRLNATAPWAFVESFTDGNEGSNFNGDIVYSKEIQQYPHMRVTIGGVTPMTDYPTYRTGVGYTPAAAGTPLATQVINIFLPNGNIPAAGWPSIHLPLFSNLTQNSNITSIVAASQPLRTFIERGYAIWVSTPTGSDVGHNGLGVFRSFGTAQYLDPTQPQAEKDGVWVNQYYRAFASLYHCDPTRLAVFGNSGGGQVAAWAGLHQDHANVSGDFITSQTSRANAVILRITPSWYPAATQATFPASHWKQAGVETIATSLTQVTNGDKQTASYCRYAFQDATAKELNRTQPVFLMNGEPNSSTDYSLSGGDGTLTNPTLSDAALDVHDGWYGQMARRLFLNLDTDSGTSFHATNSRLNQTGTPPAGSVHTSNISNESGLASVVTDWLDEHLEHTPHTTLVEDNACINVWLDRR